MLAVDGQKARTRRTRAGGDERAGGHHDLLRRERDVQTPVERGERGRKAGEAHRRHEDEVGLRFRDGAQRGVRAAEDRRAERTPQRLRPFPARPHRKGRHAERLRVRANDVART